MNLMATPTHLHKKKYCTMILEIQVPTTSMKISKNNHGVENSVVLKNTKYPYNQVLQFESPVLFDLVLIILKKF